MQFPQGHKKVENSQPGLAPTSRGPHTPEAPRPRGASWENPGRAARTRGGRTPDSAPALRSGTRRPPAEGRGREAPGPPRGLADDGNRPDRSPRPQPSGQGRLSARPGSCPRPRARAPFQVSRADSGRLRRPGGPTGSQSPATPARDPRAHLRGSCAHPRAPAPARLCTSGAPPPARAETRARPLQAARDVRAPAFRKREKPAPLSWVLTESLPESLPDSSPVRLL